MAENNKLHFIMTGGTIDSYYDGTKVPGPASTN